VQVQANDQPTSVTQEQKSLSSWEMVSSVLLTVEARALVLQRPINAGPADPELACDRGRGKTALRIAGEGAAVLQASLPDRSDLLECTASCAGGVLTREFVVNGGNESVISGGVISFPVADMTVRISRKEIKRRRFSSQRTM